MRFLPLAPDESEPLLQHPSQILEDSAVNDNGMSQNGTGTTPIIFTSNIGFIFGTLGLFAICVQGYTKLFTIYFSSKQPLGQGLTSEQLGYVLSASLIGGMAVQATLFNTIERAVGYTACYRACFLLSSFAFFFTPVAAAGLAGSGVLFWTALVTMSTLKLVTEFFGATCVLLLVSLVRCFSLRVAHQLILFKECTGFVERNGTRNHRIRADPCLGWDWIFVEGAQSCRYGNRLALWLIWRLEYSRLDFLDGFCSDVWH
jgi:hypothetical protein